MIGRSRSIGRLVVLGLALSLLVAGPLSVAGATSVQSQSAVGAAESPDAFSATPEDIDPDHVRMDVALAADGSAEWTIEFWMELDDNESTAAFESVSDDIDDDPEPYLTRFADRIDRTVATARDATDREMTIDGFAVETERQSLAREYGVITYTFDWYGFAAVDGSELRAGDAIERLYLDDGTRLLVSWPDTHTLERTSPDPDDRREHAVIWRGSQTDFVTGEPSVVVSSGTGLSPVALAAGIAVLGGLGIGIGLWYRRGNGRAVSGPISDAVSRGDDANPEADADAGPPADGESESEIPAEYLSNEERVLRLLEANGGRMKQQDVVSELDWTDAKTSKVVSGLRDEGRLESFRLGRENVLTLPGRQDEGLETGDRGE